MLGFSSFGHQAISRIGRPWAHWEPTFPSWPLPHSLTFCLSPITLTFSSSSFFNGDHFQSLYWACYNTASVLFFFFLIFWFFGDKACGILAPRPGIEPIPPALEGGFLATGPPPLPFLLYLQAVCLEHAISLSPSSSIMKLSSQATGSAFTLGFSNVSCMLSFRNPCWFWFRLG